jgi:hypothetical protein
VLFHLDIVGILNRTIRSPDGASKNPAQAGFFIIHYSLFNIHYSFFADLSREGIWSSKTQNRKNRRTQGERKKRCSASSPYPFVGRRPCEICLAGKPPGSNDSISGWRLRKNERLASGAFILFLYCPFINPQRTLRPI